MIVKGFIEMSFDSQIEQASTPFYTETVDAPAAASEAMRRMFDSASRDFGPAYDWMSIQMASDGTDGMYDISLRTIDEFDEFHRLDLNKILPDVRKSWFKGERSPILMLNFNIDGTKDELMTLAQIIKPLR